MASVTPRQAVYAHLQADEAVSTLVGGRIYHQMPPLDATYPLIVINTVSSVDRRDLSGVAYTDTRVQITAMADTLAEAERIAMAVRQSLEGYTGMMAGVLPVIGCRVASYLPDYQEEVGQTHYHVIVVVAHDA
ncbi:MAG: DUF3168 domain-containing protein [Bacillota bacterium]